MVLVAKLKADSTRMKTWFYCVQTVTPPLTRLQLHIRKICYGDGKMDEKKKSSKRDAMFDLKILMN